MSGLVFLQENMRLKKNPKQRLPVYASKKSSCPDIVLPAGEVHLIATQVDVGVGEHGADLLEERFHEVICGVHNGVHGSKAARGG